MSLEVQWLLYPVPRPLDSQPDRSIRSPVCVRSARVQNGQGIVMKRNEGQKVVWNNTKEEKKSERKNITKLKFILLELLSYHFNLTDLTGSDLVHVPKSPHSRDGLNPFPGCCCFSSVIITNIVHGFLQLCHNSITFYTLSYKIQVPIVRKEGKRSLVCLSMYHVCRNQFNCWY